MIYRPRATVYLCPFFIPFHSAGAYVLCPECMAFFRLLCKKITSVKKAYAAVYARK